MSEKQLILQVQAAVKQEDKQRAAYNWRKRRTSALRKAGNNIQKLRASVALQRKSRKTTMELHDKTVARKKALASWRKNHTAPSTIALRWAKSKVGITENPPGSNKGPQISAWQASFGSWLIGLAWCGVFCGVALREAGVRVTSRIASVAMIEDDARLGRNGFVRWLGSTQGRRGDLAVIGGRGVHVEIIRRKFALWYLTFGGNTGDASVSDGGGVFGRVRFFTSVHGCARPAYPTKP